MKYTKPNGNCTNIYVRVDHVRASRKRFLICSHQLNCRLVKNGRRGMRTPNNASTSLPSISAIERTDNRNTTANGKPMIKIIKLNDKESPDIPQTKYTMPVIQENKKYNSAPQAFVSPRMPKKRLVSGMSGLFLSSISVGKDNAIISR